MYAAGVLLVATVPLFTSWIPLPLNRPPPSHIYNSDHDFVHDTGTRHSYGWEAYFREHRPGYLVKGLKNGGDRLKEGTYRYDYVFALRPGHLTSLISGANDMVRLEVIDQTSKETLIVRTFQLADFQNPQKGFVKKGITFSTWQRDGHLFEPRVYWQGLSGIFLKRVELVRLSDVSWNSLQKKAADFEDLMSRDFLDRGYVVIRDPQGLPEDTADAAIWTGLYVSAEALRYKATQNKQAQQRMEESLWALHALVQASPFSGTMVRYRDAKGKVLEQAASKDTYTGFFYGAAQALPYVRSPALKKALLEDLNILAGHFLENDLAFSSPYGHAVDMNPYPAKAFVAEAMQDLRTNGRLRRDLIKVLRAARWYFWVHGQRPPASFTRYIKMLKHPATARFEEGFVPLLNDVRTTLKLIQENVHRSARRGARQGFSETPYIKLDLLLLRALNNLDVNTGGKPLAGIEDLKILPSQSLHALHFLKVAGEMLPKPNRFEAYYQNNLFEGKALLRTAVQWHQIDEDALSAVLGQTDANTRRTSSSHLSFLALHDLILLEKDPLIRFNYQKLFEDQFAPMRSDGNAMIDAMHTAVGLSTKQLGLAMWSLGRYPEDRRGKGEGYWKANRAEILAAFGGEVNGQAREPLPPDLRPRDAFLWQRSAHSIRGDQEGWSYPPLDYLFAYWLSRTTAETPLIQK